MKFTKHEICWDDEKISRFWDFLSSNPLIEETYFSRQVGDALINEVERYIPLNGKILDFGCGKGFLIDKLLCRGFTCQGADFSDESVSLVSKKFHDRSGFDGVVQVRNGKVPFSNESFDVVMMVETLEHLLPAVRESIMTELRRIIQPEGYIVITVPNNENLDARKVICPECGCVFHPVQHVSSWCEESLSRFLHDYGFDKVFCKGVQLRPPTWINSMKSIFAMLRRKNRFLPHLLFVGRKRN